MPTQMASRLLLGDGCPETPVAPSFGVAGHRVGIDVSILIYRHLGSVGRRPPTVTWQAFVAASLAGAASAVAREAEAFQLIGIAVENISAVFDNPLLCVRRSFARALFVF